jgi:hypothetical protein
MLIHLSTRSDFRYAIIDGRQRLEASSISLNGSPYIAGTTSSLCLMRLYLSLVLATRISRQTIQPFARIFDTFNLSVMSVITDDFGKINELFVRPESQQATDRAPRSETQWLDACPQVFRRLAEHEFFKNRIRFQDTAGSGQERSR